MASSTKFDNLAQTLVSVFLHLGLKIKIKHMHNAFQNRTIWTAWQVKERMNTHMRIAIAMVCEINGKQYKRSIWWCHSFFNEVLPVKDSEFQFARKVYGSLV